MKTSTTELSNYNKIKTLLKDRVKGIKSQDVEKAVSMYSNDFLMFDVVGELSATGALAAKERLKTWFGTMQEFIAYEEKNINIAADNNIAYCNNYNHIVAVLKDGKDLNMWWRETLCFKKSEDKWLIVSAHSSVPFDAQNGMASTGLKPLSDTEINKEY